MDLLERSRFDFCGWSRAKRHLDALLVRHPLPDGLQRVLRVLGHCLLDLLLLCALLGLGRRQQHRLLAPTVGDDSRACGGDVDAGRCRQRAQEQKFTEWRHVRIVLIPRRRVPQNVALHTYARQPRALPPSTHNPRPTALYLSSPHNPRPTALYLSQFTSPIPKFDRPLVASLPKGAARSAAPNICMFVWT